MYKFITSFSIRSLETHKIEKLSRKYVNQNGILEINIQSIGSEQWALQMYIRLQSKRWLSSSRFAFIAVELKHDNEKVKRRSYELSKKKKGCDNILEPTLHINISLKWSLLQERVACWLGKTLMLRSEVSLGLIALKNLESLFYFYKK